MSKRRFRDQKLNGGNSELALLTIQSVMAVQLTGTAGSGQTVEIYSDENNQGHIYLGCTAADGIGNFILTLMGPPSLPYIRATSLDATANTPEFSAPVATRSEASPQRQLPKEFALSPNYPNPL